MSRLDELIKELCPDGVEFKRLGDIAKISRGGNFQKKDYVLNGIPCIHYGQIYVNYNLFVKDTISFISEETAKKQKFAEPNDIIMAVTSENINDVCKSIAWLGTTKVAISGHSAIIKHSLNPKYLIYLLHSEQFYTQKIKIAHGTKVIEVTPDKLNNIIIPVPPLPIQEEIVRILDKFTSLTAELKAELKVRKKQYEYYRDALLTFDEDKEKTEKLNRLIKELCPDGVEYKSFIDVADYIRGITYGKSDEINDNRNGYKLLRANNITLSNNVLNFDDIKTIDYNVKIKESQFLKKNDILICAGSGSKEHIGKVAFICQDMDYTFGGFMGVIRTKEYVVLPRYMFHILTSNMFKIYLKKISDSNSSTINNINNSTWKNFSIPVPPMPIQEEIVRILDRFDTLCNDLSAGLPAEIEKRQKQYEYFRDRLLTFKPKE